MSVGRSLSTPFLINPLLNEPPFKMCWYLHTCVTIFRGLAQLFFWQYVRVSSVKELQTAGAEEAPVRRQNYRKTNNESIATIASEECLQDRMTRPLEKRHCIRGVAEKIGRLFSRKLNYVFYHLKNCSFAS